MRLRLSQLRSSWVLIALAAIVIIYAGMRLVELFRNQESVVEAVVFVSVSAEEVLTDDEFIMSIHVHNATEVYGSSVKMVFDPEMLAVVAQNDQVVIPGDFFASQPSTPVRNIVNPETGIIEYAITLRQPAEPVSGGGILGIVRLRALRDTSVAIGVTEAQLLSPQFEEVNGQKIAASVESIPVNIQAMTVDRNAQNLVASQPESAPVVSQSPDDETSPVSELVTRLGNRSPLGILIGGLFFFIGLILFLIGLRTYSQLYRSYST